MSGVEGVFGGLGRRESEFDAGGESRGFAGPGITSLTRCPMLGREFAEAGDRGIFTALGGIEHLGKNIGNDSLGGGFGDAVTFGKDVGDVSGIQGITPC